MPLKFKFTDLFRGKFPSSKLLYEQLEDLQSQIDNKSDAKAVIKKDVKITQSSLKKAFGTPKKFDNVGVVFNNEGAYLVVSDGDKKFYFCNLDEV